MNSAKKMMNDRISAPRKRSFFRLVLPWFNLTIAAGLSVGLMGVTHRLLDTEQENSALELELLRTRSHIDAMKSTSERQFQDLVQQTRRDGDVRRLDQENWSLAVRAMEIRLAAMESEARVVNDQTTRSFRTELTALRSAIEHDVSEKSKNVEGVFREFEASHQDGLVLLYAEFDYVKSRDGEKARTKTVSGWGTGFFVSENGHIVTNKHVVQPWKFDPDLAAMIALGEIVIDEKSQRICAWRAGTRALDRNGEPDFSTGFNTHQKKNLHLIGAAPDSMKERELDMGDIGPTYLVHDLDNNDLVILKADALDCHALPLSDGAEDERSAIRKLDPVMALGFPRGQNGLESGVAESSPSIGTVRKVESTIHVTASIIPGNSGGPLIGPSGKVVGVVTRVYSETLGICIKVDHVRKLLELTVGANRTEGVKPAHGQSDAGNAASSAEPAAHVK